MSRALESAVDLDVARASVFLGVDRAGPREVTFSKWNGFSFGDHVRVRIPGQETDFVAGDDGKLCEPGSAALAGPLRRWLARRAGVHAVVIGEVAHVWCTGKKWPGIEADAAHFGFRVVWHVAKGRGRQREPTFRCNRKDHDCVHQPEMARDCWLVEHGA